MAKTANTKDSVETIWFRCCLSFPFPATIYHHFGSFRSFRADFPPFCHFRHSYAKENSVKRTSISHFSTVLSLAHRRYGKKSHFSQNSHRISPGYTTIVQILLPRPYFLHRIYRKQAIWGHVAVQAIVCYGREIEIWQIVVWRQTSLPPERLILQK